MGSFLQKFGAIESRIASYSCPPGTTGRIHAIRLRRCFGRNSHRHQSSTALKETSSQGGPKDAGQLNGSYRHNHFGDSNTPLWPSVTEQGRKTTEEDGSAIRRARLQNLEPSSKPASTAEAASLNTSELGHDKNTDLRLHQGPDGQRSHSEEVLFTALRRGDPYAILKALKYLIHHDGSLYTANFISTIPGNTFSELLRSIDPQYALGRQQQLLEEVSPQAVRRLRLPPLDLKGYHRLYADFLSQIRGIIKARQEKHGLCLSDFKYLLKCARVLGNPELAEEIWSTMEGQPGGRKTETARVVADAECYNHYLAARCHSDVKNPLLRFRLRIIPDNVAPRAWKAPPYTLRGHCVGPGLGIKAQVSNIFHKMTQDGIAGSEEAFCWMIIALAREGEVAGVASILKRVWDIDVSALLASSDESDLLPAKAYLPDSPLYPSKQLLFTIAHIYGINNDIPTALRLIDYVSRQYSVAIPTSAWSELLNWTFVLSQKSSGARLRRRTQQGQLPAEAVSNLWATMTTEPYSVRPTMSMYNKLIINLLQRQRYGEVQQRMIEAQRLLVDSMRRLSHRVMSLKAALSCKALSKALSKKKTRDIEYWRLRVKINRQYLRRWVRLMIGSASRSLKHSSSWSSQGLPNFLEKWELFSPNKVVYPVRAGVVSFSSGTSAKHARRRKLRETMRMESRRRRMMDWMKRRVMLRRAQRRGMNKINGPHGDSGDQAQMATGVDSESSSLSYPVAASDWER